MNEKSFFKLLRGGIVSFLAVVFTVLLTSIPAYAEDSAPQLGAPDYAKTLIQNEDGSYSLRLSVTGASAESSSTSKANVIVIMDTSGSMKEDIEDVTYEFTEDPYGDYGIDDGGEYQKLESRVVSWWPYEEDDFLPGESVPYSGKRYRRESHKTESTRIKVAQNAANKLVSDLSKNNTSEHPDTVQFALIDFNKKAHNHSFGDSDSLWTTNAEEFSSENSFNPDEGTNWEAALIAASKLEHDNDPTFVIFISDGDPTYYVKEEGGVGGSGYDKTSNVSKSYKEALPAAKNLVDNKLNLYSIGVFGNVSRGRGLVNFAYTGSDDQAAPEGHYFEAKDAAALDNVIDSLIGTINQACSYTDVTFTDVLTPVVAIENPGAVDFKYYKNAKDEPLTEWNDIPDKCRAHFDSDGDSISGGKVVWGVTQQPQTLEPGVTYTLEFKIKETEVVDNIVRNQLSNDQIKEQYPELANYIKKQPEPGHYTVDTNITEGNPNSNIEYRKVNTVTGSDPVISKPIQSELGTGAIVFPKPAIIGPATHSAKHQILVVKKISGRDIQPKEEFTFKLTPTGDNKNEAPMPFDGSDRVVLKNGEDPVVSMQNAFSKMLAFEEGTFTYDVTEVVPERTSPGLTYSSEKHTLEITIKLSDDKLQYQIKSFKIDGNEVESVTPMVFTNTYKASEVTLPADSGISVTKVLGRDWKKDDEFSFTLTAGKNTAGEGVETPMPKHVLGLLTNNTVTIDNKDKDHKATFGDITFEHPGTYNYIVKENVPVDAQDGVLNGVHYDTQEHMISIVVEDDLQGNLKVASSVEDLAVSINNTYQANSVTIGDDSALQVEKVLNGRSWEGSDEFSFTLTAGDNTPMPTESDSKVTIGNSTKGHTAAFGAITFDKPGSYTYTVTEDSGNIPGISYAESQTVIVTVTDPGDGQLKAEISPSNKLTFTNTYAADEIVIGKDTQNGIKVAKIIDGADRGWQPGDSFTFELKAVSNDAGIDTPMPKKSQVEVKDKNSVYFGDITFTKAGTYNYQVVEVEPNQKLAGMTYNTDPVDITVVINDNGKGKLVTNSTPTVIITNKYADASVTIGNETNAGISVSKTIDGRDEWLDTYKFEFTITADEGNPEGVLPNPATITIDKDHKTLSFGEMTFTKPGTYTYTVSEASEDQLPGMQYAESQKVTVVVSQNFKTGQLEAEISHPVDKLFRDTQNDGNLEFTNIYTTGSTSIDTGDKDTGFGLTKTFTGRPNNKWENDDKFEFTISANDGAPLPEKTTATVTGQDGAIDFGSIEYPKAGTFTYNITETNAGKTIDGIAYDGHTATIEVTVTDNGDGTLTAAVTQKNQPEFKNVYKTEGSDEVATETQFGVTKVLQGRDWTENDNFTFTLEAQTEGAPMPEGAEGNKVQASVSKSDLIDIDGVQKAPVNFGSISFDSSLLPEGEASTAFDYKITEVKPDQTNGIDYDDHSLTVTVTLSDVGNGKVAAASTFNGKKQFTNTYTTNTVNNVTLAITKDFINQSQDEGQFKFAITPVDDGISSDKLASKTIEGRAALFGETAQETVEHLSFDKEDAGKTFGYKVAEVIPDGVVDGTQGITYDRDEHLVEYKVSDDGNGNLSVTAYLDHDEVNTITGDNRDSGVIVAFTNRYDASVVVNGGEGTTCINAKKVLNNTNLEDNEFTFNVIDAKKNVVSTGTNNQKGIISFSPIEYTSKGITEDIKNGIAVKNDDGTYSYTYSVVEADDSLKPGVSQNVPEFAITVVLTDNHDGTFKAEVVYPDGSDGRLVFENTYNAQNDVVVTINGTKTPAVAKESLVAPDIEGKYTFELTSNTSGAPMPQGDGNIARNDSAGQVSFGPITFTAGNLEGVTPNNDGQRIATFEYMVTESGDVPGYTNDPNNAQTFKIVLTDDGNGTLTTNVVEDTVLFNFTNTYDVEDYQSVPTTDGLSVVKSLDGREMNDGEFHFALKDSQGQIVSNGTNKADGTVVFDQPVTFSAPGDYLYTVAELHETLGGITYDETRYTATAHVKDNGLGELKVSWTVDNDENVAKFSNTYTPESTQVIFAAAKALDGRDLKDGEFKFELVDNQGNVQKTATNAADGTISFDPIEFSQAGTYTFTIREVAGDDKTITYDDHEVKVVVTVKDDLQGHLVADSVEYDGEAKFTNKYTEPVTPEEPTKPEGPTKPVLPITGDSLAFAALGLGVAGVVALGSFVVLRKKK